MGLIGIVGWLSKLKEDDSMTIKQVYCMTKYCINKPFSPLEFLPSLAAIQARTVASEEDYQALLELYDHLGEKKNRLVKGIDPIETVNKVCVLQQALGEKLCLLPKNVTPEQLREAAQRNSDLEDLLDEDEADYLVYAKRLAIEQHKKC